MLVTFWWWPEGADEWEDLEDRLTDSAGKTTFSGYSFPYYPMKCRLTIPEGQIRDGVEYGGYTSPDLMLNDNVTYNITLFPPPLEEKPYLAEVYRDIEIWWKPSISAYTAEVTPLHKAAWPTLPEMRAWIDEILLLLYPPEDPYEGLFAQIVVAVQVWVLVNMPGWVLEWGSIVNNYLTEVINNITNVYNDLRQYITNVYNNVYETINNTYNTFREYITNVYNYITEETTNIYNTTNEYVTNIIGTSVEWVEERLAYMRTYVDGRLAVWDSTSFLANPLGIISGVFAASRLVAEHDVIERFWLGFEEGLTEEIEG